MQYVGSTRTHKQHTHDIHARPMCRTAHACVWPVVTDVERTACKGEYVQALTMSPMPAMAIPSLKRHLDATQVCGPLLHSHEDRPRYTSIPIQSDTMGKKQNQENQVNACPPKGYVAWGGSTPAITQCQLSSTSRRHIPPRAHSERALSGFHTALCQREGRVNNVNKVDCYHTWIMHTRAMPRGMPRMPAQTS